jgi:hypothetical protein
MGAASRLNSTDALPHPKGVPSPCFTSKKSLIRSVRARGQPYNPIRIEDADIPASRNKRRATGSPGWPRDALSELSRHRYVVGQRTHLGAVPVIKLAAPLQRKALPIRRLRCLGCSHLRIVVRFSGGARPNPSRAHRLRAAHRTRRYDARNHQHRKECCNQREIAHNPLPLPEK